jgi:hypothetical protein
MISGYVDSGLTVSTKIKIVINKVHSHQIKKTMKKYIIISAILLVSGLFLSNSVQAQWGTNGNHIYNTNTGNVGIGTSTPSTNLNVYNSSGTAYLQVESPYSGTGTPLQNIGVIQCKNSTTGDLLYIGLRKKNGAHDMVQSVYDASTSTWREFIYFNFGTRKYEMRNGIGDAEFKNTGNMLFNNTGAVGINMGAVTIPSGVKLAVNGKVNCKEVEVTLSGWSDFVFNSNYKLKSLYEVEEFINQNKHLPDVPSENEVLENGSNLGQMDAILLQKIEELTLYMIQLKKENDQLKTELSKLTK